MDSNPNVGGWGAAGELSRLGFSVSDTIMKLRCPDCNAPIQADDIIRLLVAKCSACVAVFGFEVPSANEGPPSRRP